MCLSWVIFRVRYHVRVTALQDVKVSKVSAVSLLFTAQKSPERNERETMDNSYRLDCG